MPKLCQIIAITNGKKEKAKEEVTQVYHRLQKGELLTGISRTYQPKDEDGEKLPAEDKRVQMCVTSAIQQAQAAWTELFDTVATQDWGNTEAKADVVVEGVGVILANVPVTNLLFLEKQLIDIHTFINKLPTLDPAVEWEYDENISAHRSKPIQTIKTKKINKPVVMHPPTKEHPAQVVMGSEDIMVGTWTTTNFSGAIPEEKKRAMLDKVQQLQEAVKFARETANAIEVTNKSVGKEIFGFITG